MLLPRKSEATSEFIVPEDGVYTLELIGFDDPVASSFDADKERIKLKFAVIDDEEYDGVEVHQWYGVSMHVRARLYGVVKALRGGADIDEHEDIDLEDLIGKKVQGTLEQVTKPRRDNPEEKVTFANVVSVAPIRRKKNAVGTGASLDEAKADQRKKQKEADAEDDPFAEDEEVA